MEGGGEGDGGGSGEGGAEGHSGGVGGGEQAYAVGEVLFDEGGEEDVADGAAGEGEGAEGEEQPRVGDEGAAGEAEGECGEGGEEDVVVAPAALQGGVRAPKPAKQRTGRVVSSPVVTGVRCRSVVISVSSGPMLVMAVRRLRAARTIPAARCQRARRVGVGCGATASLDWWDDRISPRG